MKVGPSLELVDEAESVRFRCFIRANGIVRVEVADASATPVFDQERADLLVPREMVDLQR